jgi:Transcriptional regulators
MLNEEQKKALKEMSASVTRYIIEQVEACKAEEMMSDISVSMTAYLTAISEMSEPTLSELAARMGRSKPSATIAVDKLEEKGYVQRVQANDDRRSFHIRLTEKGRHFSELKKTAELKICEKISRALSDEEIKQFIAINKKIFE